MDFLGLDIRILELSEWVFGCTDFLGLGEWFLEGG